MIYPKEIIIFLKHLSKWWVKEHDLEKIKKEYNELFSSKKRVAKKIDIENISKVYPNGVKALDSLSLKIKQKDFVVLLGPSGCGKTTLLRMIAGLESISDGYIKFDSTTMNSTSPKDREIAMVFQNYALYPFMTVYKNISFGLKNKSFSNSSYRNATQQIKEIKNPLYLKIIKHKIMIKKLSKIDDKTKDDLVRIKMLLFTAKKRKDSKIIGDLNKDKKEIHLRIKNFKNDASRKKEILKLKKSLVGLKKENKSLQIKNKKQIQKDVEKLFSKKLRSAKIWKENIRNTVSGITNMLGIGLYVNRKPAELSGGQRQRVALARAISKESGLYLYDEPLSNLDAKLRATMRKEIRKIHNQMNATSLYVTHDQIEAMSMADKIVVLHKGYIQQVGTPKELMESPMNMFVAKFIGNTEINVFNGVWIKNTNSFSISKKAKIVVSKWKKENVDQKILMKKNLIGIRPEHIITNPQIVNNIDYNKFSGSIVDIEILGNDVLVTAKSDSLGEIRMIVPLSFDPKMNQKIDFAINLNKVLVFDKETGYNILQSYDQENIKAREVWVNGEYERKKNIYIMNKEKNKMSLTARVQLLIYSLLSKKSRERIKASKKEIDYGDQKIAN